MNEKIIKLALRSYHERTIWPFVALNTCVALVITTHAHRRVPSTQLHTCPLLPPVPLPLLNTSDIPFFFSAFSSTIASLPILFAISQTLPSDSYHLFHSSCFCFCSSSVIILPYGPALLPPLTHTSPPSSFIPPSSIFFLLSLQLLIRVVLLFFRHFVAHSSYNIFPYHRSNTFTFYTPLPSQLIRSLSSTFPALISPGGGGGSGCWWHGTITELMAHFSYENARFQGIISVIYHGALLVVFSSFEVLISAQTYSWKRDQEVFGTGTDWTVQWKGRNRNLHSLAWSLILLLWLYLLKASPQILMEVCVILWGSKQCCVVIPTTHASMEHWRRVEALHMYVRLQLPYFLTLSYSPVYE